MANTRRPTRKAPNGAGSVHYHQARKRWVAQCSYTDDLDRPHRKTFYGNTEQAARSAMVAWQVDHARGSATGGPAVTVATAARAWLASCSVRPTTATRYRQVVEGHIVRLLGHLPVGKVTPRVVKTFMAERKREGSHSTSYERVVLGLVLGSAVEEGLIAVNPVRATRARQETQEYRILDGDQLRRFLDAAPPMYRVMVTTGLRLGEAQGLRWSDVDLERRQLTVRQQLNRNEARWIVQRPKTDAGRRTIPLPAAAVEALQDQRRGQAAQQLAAAPEWSGLVFLGPDGAPELPKTHLRRFRAVLVEAGLPDMRLHDLRHSAASILIHGGVPVTEVAAALGHASPAITARIYSHVIDGSLARVVAAMDRAAAR